MAVILAHETAALVQAGGTAMQAGARHELHLCMRFISRAVRTHFETQPFDTGLQIQPPPWPRQVRVCNPTEREPSAGADEHLGAVALKDLDHPPPPRTPPRSHTLNT